VWGDERLFLMRRLIVLAAAAALLVSCGGSGETVEVSVQNDNQTVVGNVGDTFSLRLGENPSTGYSWEITTEPDATVVQKLSSEYTPGETGMAGAEGVREWRYKALEPGTTTLAMDYRRPFGDEGSANTFTVTFEVQG
jgi:inhibitor of cysteine peptidase